MGANWHQYQHFPHPSILGVQRRRIRCDEEHSLSPINYEKARNSSCGKAMLHFFIKGSMKAAIKIESDVTILLLSGPCCGHSVVFLYYHLQCHAARWRPSARSTSLGLLGSHALVSAIRSASTSEACSESWSTRCRSSRVATCFTNFAKSR